MTDLQALYQHVGRAVHKAQIVEFNLVTLWVLSEKLEPSGVDPKEDGVWSKKTLGKLLYPVIKSGVINDDTRLFLETVLSARNHLAHAFFMSEASIGNTDGILKLVREVNAMVSVFDRAIALFDHVMQTFCREADIDYLQIIEESRTLVMSTLD
ncbi:hypothetical protein JAO78_006635 [Alishewanella sp. 16-MA]|uniref:MAE-28990/MAE-18760-like HEPN domain-containing protein n=1 Tax=Alishewanella maricola TaxID=2795740 RepID=A0ABS8C2D5_9ALTE|nr:hypothetical protein [Alishewanella maricola]MCB5226488.1 hypothetical protein [Alishewanella maricola]